MLACTFNMQSPLLGATQIEDNTEQGLILYIQPTRAHSQIQLQDQCTHIQETMPTDPLSAQATSVSITGECLIFLPRVPLPLRIGK